MRIGIDIDDTICDSWDYVMPVVSDYFKIDIEELKRKNKSYSGSLDCTKEEWMEFVRKHFQKLSHKFPLKEDVVNVINKLKSDNNEIIIITARGNNGYTDPYKLSYDYLVSNNIKFDKLIINGGTKGKCCIQEKIDLFIDDSVNNCKNVNSYGIDVLLFDAKFNKECKEFKRVYNWNEIYDYIKNKR